MFRRRRDGAAASDPAAGAATPHLIDLRGVVKDYVTDAGAFRALDTIDLQVDHGEFVAVVGRSGCGKSTLMNMITGIDRATAGTVTVAGQELSGLSEGQVAVWRGRTVGVIFQFFQLLPDAHGRRERDAADGLRRAVEPARARDTGDGAAGPRRAWPTRPASCRPARPAASSSASRSRAPSPTTRRSWSRTSRPAIWIR